MDSASRLAAEAEDKDINLTFQTWRTQSVPRRRHWNPDKLQTFRQPIQLGASKHAQLYGSIASAARMDLVQRMSEYNFVFLADTTATLDQAPD